MFSIPYTNLWPKTSYKLCPKMKRLLYVVLCSGQKSLHEIRGVFWEVDVGSVGGSFAV